MNSFSSKSKCMQLLKMSVNSILNPVKHIFNLVISDSFRGFTYLSPQMKPKFKEDEATKEMVNKFSDEYLEKGWTLLLTCIRSLMIVFIIISSLIKSSNYYYSMIAVEWPIYLLVIAILDKLFQKIKTLRKIIFSTLIYLLGGIMIHRSLNKTSYALYENWMVYIHQILFTI